MKKILFYAILLSSIKVFANTGPTSLGDVNIGMSKAEYLTATSSSPIDCDNFRDKDGKLLRSELKFINPDKKSLCWSFSFNKAVTIENIKIGEISYDVIEAQFDSGEFIRSVRHSSKAIFLNDRLVRLQIYAPKVNVETLMSKYGEPKLLDKREIKNCQNRIGNQFSNNLGQLDAVWKNGEVNSIFREESLPPRKTCTDGNTLYYYILEEARQIAIIDSAIRVYLKSLSIEDAKDTKF